MKRGCWDVPQALGVKAVQRHGQEVYPDEELTMPSLPPGHRLVGVMWNSAYARALDITRPADFQQWRDSIREGRWIGFRLFFLPNELIGHCPIEGREGRVRVRWNGEEWVVS